MPLSNKVFWATHSLGEAGGFGGDNEKCVETPVSNSKPILEMTPAKGTSGWDVGSKNGVDMIGIGLEGAYR